MQFFTTFTKPHHTIGYYDELYHTVVHYTAPHYTISHHTKLHHIFSLLYLYYFARSIQSLNKQQK